MAGGSRVDDVMLAFPQSLIRHAIPHIVVVNLTFALWYLHSSAKIKHQMAEKGQSIAV